MSVMKKYITEEGKQLLEQQIENQRKRVKEVQAEKAVAYTASGDGWHDNPGFNQLEQLEQREINKLVELERKLDSSVVWPAGNRNSEKVQIGSIVKFKMNRRGSAKPNEMVCEIVGTGESDLKRKKISYDSPIGQAIYEGAPGFKAEVEIPAGKTMIEIIDLYPDWSKVS